MPLLEDEEIGPPLDTPLGDDGGAAEVPRTTTEVTGVGLISSPEPRTFPSDAPTPPRRPGDVSTCPTAAPALRTAGSPALRSSDVCPTTVPV